MKKEQLLERLRIQKEIYLCEKDPIYFMENYVKCSHPTHGSMLFSPHPFQAEYISELEKGQNTIVSASRRTGSSITTMMFLFWEAFFQPHQKIGICSNRIEQSRSNLQMVRHAYHTLPSWLRDFNPLVDNTKGYMEFANGSLFSVRSSDPCSFRGMSLSTVFIDNFTLIHTDQRQEELLVSIMPTIMTTKGSKAIIVAPGDGSSLFYDMFSDALNGRSSFNAVYLTAPDFLET